MDGGCQERRIGVPPGEGGTQPVVMESSVCRRQD